MSGPTGGIDGCRRVFDYGAKVTAFAFKNSGISTDEIKRANEITEESKAYSEINSILEKMDDTHLGLVASGSSYINYASVMEEAGPMTPKVLEEVQAFFEADIPTGMEENAPLLTETVKSANSKAILQLQYAGKSCEQHPLNQFSKFMNIVEPNISDQEIESYLGR